MSARNLIFVLVLTQPWITAFGQDTDSLLVASNPTDTLHYYAAQLDSIATNTQDSLLLLKQQYDTVTDVSYRVIEKLRHKADSMTNLNMPEPRILQQIDSVHGWRDEQVKKLRERTDKIKSGAIGRISSINLPEPIKKQATALVDRVDAFDISLPDAPAISLPAGPDLIIPGIDVPDVPGIPDMNMVPQVLPGELNQLNDYAESVPGSADELGTMVENQAANLDELSALESGMGEVEAANALPEIAIEDQSENLKQEAVKKAVNHFKGKEAQLQEAMNKMAEYKKKYSSVESLKDLPKRPPNTMKGKPFVERLVPGISLQVLRNNDWMVDLNPQVGYRISGKITTGIGWTQPAEASARAKTLNLEL